LVVLAISVSSIAGAIVKSRGGIQKP
jgi:hypothetical protein